LKQLAKDHNVAVVALQQLNRGTEGRDNKRPTLSDLRNSGDLEQDADLVCFAYRESYYLERTKFDLGSNKEVDRETALAGCRNTLELIIAKNRNGPTPTLTFFADMASNALRDAA
jgi:replicative DNA helicase